VKNLALSKDATLTFSPPTGSGVLIDGLDPTLTAIAPPAAGTYAINDALSFTVSYDQPVSVTGAPRIALTVGGQVVSAIYAAGSGTATLSFTYTVTAGDVDTDGVTLASPIDLAGGGLSDPFGDPAPLAFPDGTAAGVLVDGVRPELTVLTGPAAGIYDRPDALEFIMTFSETVNVDGVPQLSVDIGGQIRAANFVSATGATATFRYTLSATEPSDQDGVTVASFMALNGGSITDMAGNALTGLAFTPPDTTAVLVAGNVAVAANSGITSTSPIVADGTSASIITISLRNAANNPVTGFAPTFTATDTGATNGYGPCTPSDANGIATCSLTSTTAEIKTLVLATPIERPGGTVTFTAGSAVAANSSISGTSPVVADGTATATVTIVLRDASNNPVIGQTPTFAATDTGTKNVYGGCAPTDATGTATCTLRSTKAETKTLSISTPVAKAGGTVTFVAGSPSAANSDIIGTSPVSADGVSVSFITVSLADAFGNPVAGATPIFNATDTNSTNVYGDCSTTDATGTAGCTLASTRAEVKTLQLTSPIAVTGSATVTFTALLPTAANSSISGTGPVIADGGTDSTVTITLRDSGNNPVPGIVPTFDASDTDGTNVYYACSMSDAGGVSICAFTATRAEPKILRITDPVTKSGETVSFIAGPAVAATSSIAGSGPVVADGVEASTITIVLRDAFNNLVSGVVPTFSATDTLGANVQTACTSTESTGTATCALRSTRAELKVLQLLTPISKTGAGIAFLAGPVSAATSTITGTGPVNPDGTSTSTITVTLRDAANNPVGGIIPTFTATGSNNNYGACSTTTPAGAATCTLASTIAETKTLAIVSPVSKSDGTVDFVPGSAVAANSTITGTGPVLADGNATSMVTITLRDSASGPVVGIVPTFSASGTANALGPCSPTNTAGVSTCTLSSTKAELKTLSITAPMTKTGDAIEFTPGLPSAATSTIVVTDPNLADGATPAEVTITIRDALGNAVPGVTPTFAVSGTANTLGACAATDSAGQAVCEITSTKAEGKTVSLLTPVAVTGNTADFNPAGIDLVVPIEMIDRGLASNTKAINFVRSTTSINPADYVAETNTYVFEIVADNTNTTTAYTVSMVNAAGAVVPDSEISIPPSTTQRRFSVIWTPSNAAESYRVRIPATATVSQVRVHSAKILVQQTKAVATRIYIPLTGGDVFSDTNSDPGGFVTSTNSTTFAQPSESYFYFWTRNDAAYDTIPTTGTPWTLETISSISNSTSTVTIALFDKANKQQITDATTTVTGTTTTAVRQANFTSAASNFHNGDQMEVRLRTSNSTYSARLFKAGLWLRLKYLRRAEVYQRLATRRSLSTSGSIPDGRFLWDASAWQNPTVYFQAWCNVTTSSVVLMTNGAVDTGITSPTTVHTIVPLETYGLQRSPALSLTNLNRYWVQQNRLSGTPVIGGAFMVIQVQE
jgi:hypothetical protein